VSVFFVAGLPAPQGSKSAVVIKGRAVIIDDNSKSLRAWRKSVAAAAEVALGYGAPPLGPVKLSLGFVLPRGVTVTRPAPSVRPDLDKLVRAVMDAVTASGAWGDDAQVVELHCSKVYGAAPGVHVLVEPVPPGAAYGPVFAGLEWEWEK
jgi:Holliday junction resolvase RusA-like endonuclease